MFYTDESLELMFTEVVALQESLEGEKAESRKVALEVEELAARFRSKQDELQTQMDTIRKIEAEINDLAFGLNVPEFLSTIPQQHLPKREETNENFDSLAESRREAVKEVIFKTIIKDFSWVFLNIKKRNFYLHGNHIKIMLGEKMKLNQSLKVTQIGLILRLLFFWFFFFCSNFINCFNSVTMVDALDTLWIMDLKDDFKLARDWIASNLHFDNNRDVSLFETTIRELGGLLSAYELSKDKMFLDKAEDLGIRLLRGFSDASGIPHAAINLNTGTASSPSWIRNLSILSEIGTLQLEFLYLAYHTNKPEYAIKVSNFNFFTKFHYNKMQLKNIILIERIIS